MYNYLYHFFACIWVLLGWILYIYWFETLIMPWYRKQLCRLYKRIFKKDPPDNYY